MLIEMAPLSRDRKRKLKLAQRQRRLDALGQRRVVATTLAVKERMAEAVHAAVCEVNGGSGLGRCAHYAVAGAILATVVTGKRYIPQAGSLYLSADPADPSLYTAMVAEDGIESGEFHCWCIGPVEEGRKSGPVTPDQEFMDFSARHFKALVEGFGMVEDRQRLPDGGFLTVFGLATNRWRRPDPPKYIWSNQAGLPEWVKYQADKAATETLFRGLADFEPVIKLAGQYYQRAKGTCK
jgi:hypothetical protein